MSAAAGRVSRVRNEHPTTGVRCWDRRSGVKIPGAVYCGAKVRSGSHAGRTCGFLATRPNDDGSWACPYHCDAARWKAAAKARKPVLVTVGFLLCG